MLYKQFYLESLGHASYFVGSEEPGEAFVLDGARAELNFPVRPMTDGERLQMGEVLIDFLRTPGHTPEHISLLIIDRSRGDEPVMLFSGGALLVGDVARPDLLGGAEETRRNAVVFCHTQRDKVRSLPDFIEVYPTHVAGSLCGGSIGSRLSITIGHEPTACEAGLYGRLLRAVPGFEAIALKWHTRSHRVSCEAVNGLGRKPKTGAQAKQGQRRAGIVRHQDATTGA